VTPRDGGDVLVVRHGPDRGRLHGYLQEVFDAVARRHPDVAARLRFHETGAPPPDLDGVAAVLFLLADPLRELYPPCYAEARAVADEARSRGIAVANDPDALSNTVKSVQAARWRERGIPTPAHLAFRDQHELEAVLGDVRFPAILRADELHAQEGMRLCRSAEEVVALPPDAIRYPGALAEFVDVRAGYGWRRRR
jgi:hypothetical protein